MGKKDDIKQLTNLISKSLRHKIGSIVNKDDFYASKYAKDADAIMKEAKRAASRQNWNNDDKLKIKQELKEKLFKELEEKEFLDDKKFDIMDEEMEKALLNLF